MVYTCYDMIRDCRANSPAGWRYFLTCYVPAIRRILTHYGETAGDPRLRAILLELHQPQSSLFASMEPAPERIRLRRVTLARSFSPIWL